MHSILKSSKELLGTIQIALASSIDDILGALPDSAARDKAIRKHFSKHAPCVVADSYWSVINVLDPDFTGYDAAYFTTTNTSTTHPSDYTPSLYVIRNLALAAKLAYEDPDVIKCITNQWNMKTDDTFFMEFQDTQAYIMYDDANIVLVFRGTELLNPKDWQADFKMKLVDVVPRQHVMSDGVHVKTNTPMAHTGFLEALGLHDHTTHDYLLSGNNDAFSQIHHVLSVLQLGTKRKIWVTGHSLGAALSSIFTAQMLLERDVMVLGEGFGGVYTYGQPRTGNAAYCELFADLEKSGRVIRVVNQKDIVPHVPPMTTGYTHHGNKVFIDNKCNIYYTRYLYENLPPNFNRGDKKNQMKRAIAHSKGKKQGALRKESSLEAMVFLLLPKAMQDHYPCDYLRHLERAMDN